LGEVTELVPGVVHVEVDAEKHLDLVRRLDIRKTPTTLVLDARAVEVKRASGQPRKADVLAALGQALP
ncbi:MAG: thioredoxin family protein, partial [Actinomycetota bacterium]|nr:thioredoxin family protein [Actinomycetota bacterium]